MTAHYCNVFHHDMTWHYFIITLWWLSQKLPPHEPKNTTCEWQLTYDELWIALCVLPSSTSFHSQISQTTQFYGKNLQVKYCSKNYLICLSWRCQVDRFKFLPLNAILVSTLPGRRKYKTKHYEKAIGRDVTSVLAYL